MSYCRWSSDDYQCDVYVWPDIDGTWRTAVAGRRHVITEPLPPVVPFSDFEMIGNAELVDIGLPLDGDQYADATPGECAQRLLTIREAGYNVPQYAIDALLEEATP